MFKKEKLSKREEEKVNEKFESFKDEEYSEEDMSKVFENEENILNTILSDENLRRFFDDVKVFLSMLKDFFTRVYTEVPMGTIMAIVGSLLYLLCPLDLIPDAIPVVGFLDDAAILAACIKAVRIDIEKYKAFKEI